MFTLRFPQDELPYWASRYDSAYDSDIEETIAPRARVTGYFTKEEFLQVCYWKTPRSKSRCEKNPEDFIVAVVKTALSTSNERLRIEVLTLLEGVGWPTASVFLHFAHPDPYPLLDVRALWSLGMDTPPYYDFDFWWAYVLFCRELAQNSHSTMRMLDRALWQYSKENQHK